MSRTTGGGWDFHLASRSHTRCNMLLLVLNDGTEIGITDHDKDLSFDVLDTGAVTYSSGTGILASDVSLSASLDADNYEVTGPVGETITLDGILGGRFDRARAYLFQVNWKSLADGALKILAGSVAEVRVEGGTFVFEVRSDMDLYNQVVGRLITNNCDADYGDTRCGAAPESVTGTVTAGGSLTLSVSYAGSYADNYFNLGTLVGLSGSNAGVTREIFDWSVAGAIELFAPLPSAAEVGDTFTVKRGCGKSRVDCMARNNILNFRGYPEVPGQKALHPAIPGQGND